MTNRASKSITTPMSVGMSAAGLLAVVVIFALYATGHGNLPWWLNGLTVLMPLGLAIGVVSAIVRAHR